jgi:DNA-directed RNA polymerase subunit RPC12/RpoP
MDRVSVTAEFKCFSCKKDNRKTFTLDRTTDVANLNMRRKPVINIKCTHCGTPNSVEVDV